MNIYKSDSFTPVSANEYKTYKIRVLLFTPYKIVQESLKVLIEDNLGMNVMASIGNLNNLFEYTNLKSPDVVLIYLMDEDNETVEIISQLLKVYPRVRVIVATGGTDFINQIRAIQLGAVGIVHKEQNIKTLITAIRQAHRNGSCGNRVLLSKLLSSHNAADMEDAKAKGENGKHRGFGVESITKREKDVIALIGEGLKNKDIAARLSISQATIRQHLSSIFRKLEVADRIDLVIYTYQHGLLEFPA